LLDDIADVVDLPIYDEHDDELFSKSSMSFLPSGVSLQKFNTYLQPFHDSHKCEFADHPAKEQATASIFMFDDITEILGEPRYDKYNDDYEVEFSEQGVALSKYENDCIQQSKEIEKCAYDNSEENEESLESGERTLSLCFSSFKLLKKNVYNVSNQKSSMNDVEYE
jgi:hypothetical protein